MRWRARGGALQSSTIEMACLGQTRTAFSTLARSDSGGFSLRMYSRSSERTSKTSGATSMQRALLSHRSKLTTTFIFPSPDSAKSYSERKSPASMVEHQGFVSDLSYRFPPLARAFRAYLLRRFGFSPPFRRPQISYRPPPKAALAETGAGDYR